MLLAQISDTHLTTRGANDQYSDEKIVALEKCVDDINSLNPLPDAVIHTGDLSHNGTRDELLLAKASLDRLASPYHVTPGNRDCPENIIDIFEGHFGGTAIFGPIIYMIDEFPIKLVSFDTTCPSDNLGVLNFEKLASLDNILCAYQSDPIIIFSHHPPFYFSGANSRRLEFRSENAISLFGEIIDRHSQIVALFCGHSHLSIRKNLGMFDAYIAPPVCKLLDRSLTETDPNRIGSYQLHRFNQCYQFVTEVRKLNEY